jgi:hypothetical protein
MYDYVQMGYWVILLYLAALLPTVAPSTGGNCASMQETPSTYHGLQFSWYQSSLPPLSATTSYAIRWHTSVPATMHHLL